MIPPLPIASKIAASDNWWMLGVTVLLFPLMYASLGSSPLPGKQGIDRTSRLKAKLRSLQKKPDGVSLLTVTHAQPPHMEVVAMYDADNSDEAAWVKQAEAISAELWQKIAERRKGAAR